MLTAAITGENGLCERIGEIQNVQAVFLVNDGRIVQWKAKSGIKMARPNTWTMF